MGSLGSFGEFPELIKARFITKKVNKCGIYAVSLFINGQEKVIMVDDHFMVDQWNRPAFAKFCNGKMWVAILEKVWAKILGSIWRTHWGCASDAFAPFSGLPIVSLNHQSSGPDVMWDRFLSCDAKDYCMMGCSNQHPNGDSEKIGGIVQSHIYSVLSAHEVNWNGQPTKILKLRNPHRTNEWEGDFSDKSPAWTEELKQELGWVDADDGVFFMPFQAYLNNFTATDFCMLFQDPVIKKQHKLE